MKLWLLRPLSNGEPGYEDEWGPWDPWYDKTFGFVIRADSEGTARAIAQDKGAAERYNENFSPKVPVWLSAEYSTCVELAADGEPGVVIEDHRSA